MAVSLFPDRARCLKCRKGVTEEGVLAGLFCSVKCGGFSAPVTDVAAAPRSCKRKDDSAPSGWAFKKGFAGPSLVPEKYKNDPATNVYQCENCHRFHMGHARPDRSHDPLGDALDALVKSPAELGALVRKYREAKGVTVQEVAARLKVTQKLLKAFEAGDSSVPVGFAFKVLDVLWLKVGIQGAAPRRGLPPQ